MRKNEARWTGERWRIDIQRDGTRKSFYSSKAGKRGKIEAEKKADKWLQGEDENISVSTMAERWIADMSLSASAIHITQYKGYLRLYILPEIGRKKISAVTEINLQRILDKAYAERNLAYKTLVNIRACISSFMKYCRIARVTTLRPEGLKIPQSAHRGEKKIAQPDDLKILFGNVTGHYINAYRFAILTGLRVGELLALEWADVKNGIVTVRRSVNPAGEITQGKNKNANRSFRLSSHAAAVLETQKAYLKSLGIISRVVFPNESGQMVRQITYRKTWYKFAEKNGISRITPYEMRHTFVSVADDLPDGLKKQTVGHSRSMDTEGVYGHRKQGDMERVADLIDAAFDRILNTAHLPHS